MEAESNGVQNLGEIHQNIYPTRKVVKPVTISPQMQI